MKCTILSIGTELSLGLVLDINSKFIAHKLTSMGLECNFIHIVRDNKREIKEAIKMGLKHSDIIIISGGLGPTDDDITRIVVAEALGLELIRNKILDSTSLKFIKKVKSREIEERLLRQSYIPKGAIPFKPRVGSASGFGLRYDGKWIFSIPGVPREMIDMFLQDVVPILVKINKNKEWDKNIQKKVLMTTDISETEIENNIKDIIADANRKNIKIGITANPGLVKIILIAKNNMPDSLEHFEKMIRQRLEHFVYGTDDSRISYHLKEIIANRAEKLKICTAESVTGGLIGSMITDIPGSSEYYAGGVICYSDFSKNKILGIDQKILKKNGPVSRETSMQMAINAKKIFGSDYALAVTGYAGPEDKNTGLVYLCISGPGESYEIIERRLLGSREDIKFRIAQLALNRLRVLILSG